VRREGRAGQALFANLVDRVESLTKNSAVPECEGFIGRLALGAEAVEELGDLDEIRRAADGDPHTCEF